MKISIITFCFLQAILCFSQEKDSIQTTQLNTVLIDATRVNTKTPMPFSNFSKTEISKRNLGQDIPVLMNFLPSVVTTSDAGNGFGYTGIRVRGSDATRVNITINGIPYNDSESQGTFFVNMPDFASSLQSIQLQRGVGTSTNGSGAFGASLNMQTADFSTKQNAEISNSIGSFNSYKNTFIYSSGLINDKFEISGRLSNLHSDGFVDRAKSDLQSYFLQSHLVLKKGLLKALFFGGKEKTYQSWYGVDANRLKVDRTYNEAGLHLDDFGNEQFYDNQTDNYQQHHLQLHWNQNINKYWKTNLAFHYTKGKGYFENYEVDKDLAIYQLLPIGTATKTDLINQKWLDNDFFGTTFSAICKKDKTNFIFGGSANKYQGQHFGEVIWAKNAVIINKNGTYYDNFAVKTDVTVYSKINYQITQKCNLFADLQYRNVKYNNIFASVNYNFFNPKAGITFDINKVQNLYFSYAKANKEPNRSDFENGNPVPESLDDFEFGYRVNNQKIQLNINTFYMLYKNQLVLTGALDDVGNPIRKNVGNSYRIGIEMDANVNLSDKISLNTNFTLSENKNQNLFYEVNGSQLFGNTNIAFSPRIIAANSLNIQANKALQFSFLSKFVDSQFLSNNNDFRAKLNDYTVQDFRVQYDVRFKKLLKSLELKLLVNNYLDKKFESNGSDYGFGSVYFFPQAGINFLCGATLRF